MGTQTMTRPPTGGGTHGNHRHVAREGPRVTRSVVRLTVRLIRWRTLAISLGVGLYLLVEGIAFETAYPDAASRAALTLWGQDPGLRIIAGPPTAVDTLGGFVVWDAGLYLLLILGAWTLTTTTRVLRGDEAAGRTDLVLAGPIRPGRVLASQLAVLLAACLLIGAVIGGSLAVAGAQGTGSALFGAAMAGYCGALVGIAAFSSQVFGTRGAALGSSAIVLLAAIVLRMISNSADSRTWLGWLSPAGWADHLRAFGDNRWPVLLVPLGVTVVLGALALLLRSRRDAGASLVTEREEHPSHLWGLGSPAAFAWRAAQPVLLAWAAGIAVAGGIAAALLPTIDEFLASDPGFIDMLESAGLKRENLVLGFIGVWGTMLGLVIAVYAAFRMGAVRAEEASTRAEFLLTRPVARWRWLGGHLLCLVVSVLVLSAVAGASIWVAAVAAGADLTAAEAFASVFNAVPAVAVFAGLSVLAFGLVPRLTVAIGATAAGVAYVLEIIGPMLSWPEWVVSLSPFHHLEAVPVDPFGVTGAVVLTLVGAGLAALGLLAFERRDLVGA